MRATKMAVGGVVERTARENSSSDRTADRAAASFQRYAARGRALVKFRLFYQGPLFASKGDAMGAQIDRRGGHKNDIRRAFHKQLKHYWQLHPFLRTDTHGWQTF